MEGELRWAAARLISDFGLTGELTEQVIEGKPDDSFAGRLSLIVTGQPTNTHAAVTISGFDVERLGVGNWDSRS